MPALDVERASPSPLETRRSRLRHRMVLLARSSTYADRTHHLAIALQRYATGKDHDFPIVRGVNSEKLSSRLRMSSQVFGRDVESPRGIGLLDRDIDAPQPRSIHTHVRNQVAALIRNCNVHGLADFFGLLFSGGNHPARVFQCHKVSLSLEIPPAVVGPLISGDLFPAYHPSENPA